VVAAVALTVATDVLLPAAGFFQSRGVPVSDGPLVLATAYRAVFGVVGSYVAARLVVERPMWHAMIVGAIGFLVSVVGVIGTWSRASAFGAHWYPVALVVIALPCAWVGGRIREMQLRS
jgi:hypothetical protein